MRTIYKFTLEPTDRQEVLIPYGAKVLTVQMQDSKICLWAEVETENQGITMPVLMVGTGNPAPLLKQHDWAYISTIQFYALVFHFFVPPQCKRG